MSIRARIGDDVKAAMRAGDAMTRDTLRMLLSSIQKKEIDTGTTADESMVVGEIRRAMKARTEAAIQFRQGGRPEMADKEEAEYRVLEAYLPATLDEAGTRALVKRHLEELRVTDKKGMGKVMGAIMAAHRDEVDGNLLRRIVEEALD